MPPTLNGDKPRALFVQPALASYRQELVRALAARFELTILSDTADLGSQGFASGQVLGVRHIEAPIKSLAGGRLMTQGGVLKTILADRPQVVLIFANPRFVSLWVAALACRLLGISLIGHGQGLYRTTAPGWRRGLLYRLLCKLSAGFICYTERARESLLAGGCDPAKLALAENSLQIEHPVQPTEKQFDEPGVLYLGRLREESGVQALIEAGINIQQTRSNWQLHLVGGGVLEDSLKAQYGHLDWIVWHGAIYDDARITEISRLCRLAVYPGNVGLSVVHYFGLSLPVLIHDRLTAHFPEAEYAVSGQTAWLYPHDEGIEKTLDQALAQTPAEIERLAEHAHACYQRLNCPPLGERIVACMQATMKSPR